MNFQADILEHFKINLSKEQVSLFDQYFEKLIDFNKHTNLTTITEKNDVFYKHFYDSLTLIDFINKDDATLCDMGSGAGFPSIPLKIIYPNLKITIIDSSNKRIKFLQELVELLNLENVTLVHDRIEVFGQKKQLAFDYVTARALGNMNLITEMAIPMLKISGYFIAMKGANGKEELLAAKNAIDMLGGKIINERYLELPHHYGGRSIFLIVKNKHVEGYPRPYQQMIKKPL